MVSILKEARCSVKQRAMKQEQKKKNVTTKTYSFLLKQLLNDRINGPALRKMAMIYK